MPVVEVVGALTGSDKAVEEGIRKSYACQQHGEYSEDKQKTIFEHVGLLDWVNGVSQSMTPV
jgi:hypothetical protein